MSYIILEDSANIHEPGEYRLVEPEDIWSEQEALDHMAYLKQRNPYKRYTLCKIVGRLRNIVFEPEKES